MRNIRSYKKKFKDHPFLCKMVLGAPDGPILVQQKPCTVRLICTQNRPKLSYRGVFHHFVNPTVKSFSLYLIKKLKYFFKKNVTGCFIVFGGILMNFFIDHPL